MPSILGYWDLRGFASPIRYLLHYANEDFEDYFYKFGPAPEYSREEWLKVKFTFGLDFPNLPYYIDGDVKMTQSTAILRHVARKHGLAGKTEEEICQLDVLEQQLCDLRMDFIHLAYDPKFEARKNDYLKELPNKLKLLSAYLSDHFWLLGDRLTYVDFLAYDALDFHRILQGDCLDSFPNLKGLLERVEALPAIHKYMSSSKYHRLPLTGPMSYFGGKQQE